MIILVKGASYGGNALRYAMEKEKAQTVGVKYLPDEITPIAIWNRMKFHCLKHEAEHTRGRPIQDSMVSFVVSPSPEECAGWTLEDWRYLYNEVMEDLDRAYINDQPKCKKCKPTNFNGSMSVAALHKDSKSGVLHLHIDSCRIDMDGKTNDLHQIHIRAIKAAENINRRHGWKLPEDIREERKSKITEDAFGVLRSMHSYNRNLYFDELRKKGYKIDLKMDRHGRLCGYTIGEGASVFKASELGSGHNLLASNLEATWKRLHKDDNIRQNRPTGTIVTPKPVPVVKQPTQDQGIKPSVPVSEPKPSFSIYNINVAGKNYACQIPDTVKDIFNNEATLPDNFLWSTTETIAQTAMLLFCGYVDAATSMSRSCGGGGGSTSGWGRDKDEDDERFARRCLNKAKSMHTRSRGLHR